MIELLFAVKNIFDVHVLLSFLNRFSERTVKYDMFDWMLNLMMEVISGHETMIEYSKAQLLVLILLTNHHLIKLIFKSLSIY